MNVVGTSERYGSAADHVKRYTMVDAKGRILLVNVNELHIILVYMNQRNGLVKPWYMVRNDINFLSDFDRF